MREYFKQQLEALYRLTGLQQYQKLSEMPDSKKQIGLLLDELEQVCTWFPLIPSKEKQRIISEYMLKDPEFIGLNKKIIWRWLNNENAKYFPDQSRFQEVNTTPAAPDIADKYLEQWKSAVAKVGHIIPRADGIKDQRIQQLKDNFAKLGCKHPNWIVQNEMFEVCEDCGEVRDKTEKVTTVEDEIKKRDEDYLKSTGQV